MIYLFLFIAAFISWLIGTATAGGASIIFLLMLSISLPLTVVPILVALVGTFAGIYRTFIYKDCVYWPILKWLLPGTIFGSLLGVTIFTLLVTQQTIKIFDVLLGCVLLSSGIMGMSKRKIKHDGKNWYFLPSGFFMSTLSGVIGGAPPMVNLLYQRFPLTPNQIIGTKSINLLTLQITKSIAYFALMPLYYHSSKHLIHIQGIKSLPEFILLAVIASMGAAIGISLAKKILFKLQQSVFNKLMNVMLVLFGVYFISKIFYL